MSATEHEPQPEQRSSVEISLNAKREPQVRVKVYVGSDEAEVAAARQLAVQTFYETLRACGVERAVSA